MITLTIEEYNRMLKQARKTIIKEEPKKKKLTLKQIFKY